MNPLGKQILKDVSRSFYLSIRVLPMAMREPISLGYLLARASDTLADTEGLDASVRSEMLGGFAGLLLGEDQASWWDRLVSDVIPKQSHQGEITLLQNLRQVLQWLETQGEQESEAIQKVMKQILHGQMLDIERFELRSDYRFSNDAELEQYCYLVAGCVGEFWTQIGDLSLDRFSSADSQQLREWGINYGKGLQLINILRDLPSDLASGRCYLPGVAPDDRVSLMRESARWRARARDYLRDGEDYARSLCHRRTRVATALPGLIGERTLDLMDAADWDTLKQGLKVPRWQVYHSAVQALLS